MTYRASDLLLPPALISFLRVPLAFCFPLVAEKPALAFLVLGLAAVSDVLDGWVARRFGLATATGAALDPITDKFFVFTVAVTLVLKGYLSVGDVVLLSLRELGELPLVIWFAFSHAARKKRADHPKANIPGKLATTLQFVAIGSVLLRFPPAEPWILATAAAGLIAAATYWRRALGLAERGRG
jgi:CDP-diacylglycerol--glycerol-3-phosphate 3-phosphatidyltransferase/cardiolipin synthase